MNVTAVTAASGSAVTSASTVSRPATTATTGSTASATAAAPLYSSPVQITDPLTGIVVVETRNVDTGVVTSQSPTKGALQYERTQMLATEKAFTKGARVKAA